LSSVVILFLVAVAVVTLHDRVDSDDRLKAEEVVQAVAEPDDDVVREATLVDVRAELRGLREDLNRLQQRAVDAAENRENAAETVSVFRLDFAAAEEVAQALQNVLPGIRVSVQYAENGLVVALPPDQIAHVSQTIKTLDQPRPQVLISGYLFEVAVEKLAQLGLQTEGSTSRLNEGSELQPLIETLLQSEEARLLIRPSIRAYDRMETAFESVRECRTHPPAPGQNC
jgi:type II secretory pathway component GspD/PulD (secretin)